MREDWPLVGRDGELRAIETTFSERGVSGVVLVGPAGVGKTRLARAALERLAAAGCETRWLVATRTAASIPFGAVTPLLPSGPPPSGGRLAVLHAVEAELAAHGGRDRLAIGVDDANLLDDGSVTLLARLAVEGLAFLVVTVRGAPAPEPTPDALVALWKDGGARRLGVRALPPDAVDELVGHALGGPVDGISRERLRRAVEGNPLLLREVLLAAGQDGSLERRAGVWRWREAPRGNERLAELVAGRLRAVPGAARSVLEVVACGEPLPLHLLEQVADPAAVEAAERSGLVVAERAGARLLVRLAHPLYGEAVRATVPVSRSRTIWSRLAGTLAAGPMRRADDALRAGVWQLQAGTVAHPKVLLDAARQAIARFDLGLAERLARAARAADASWDSDHLLAEILEYRGRSDEAAAVLPSTPLGDAAGRAAWAVTRAMILYWGLDRTGEAERALDVAASEPGWDLTEATRSWILLLDGRCEEALAAAERVLALPAAGEQAVVWAAAGGSAAAGLLGHSERATAIHRRGLAVTGARAGEFPWGSAQVGFGACVALLAAGRLRDAWRLADDGYQAAVATEAPVVAGGWAAFRGLVAKAQGRVATAQAALLEAVALLEDDDPYRIVRPCMAELAGVTALTGDADGAAAWLERADRRRRESNRLFDPWIERNRAWALAPTGAISQAIDHLRRAATLARERGQPTIEALALYDAARLGAGRTVRDRLDELAGTLEGTLAPALATAAAGLAAGDAVLLERAATTFADLGHRLLAAEAALEAARADRRRGRAARAGVLMAQAIELVERCEGARTPLLEAERLHSFLTSREREVVLLATTHSSREIALRLGLSRHTVHNYLARAYEKLGIAGRDELRALRKSTLVPVEEP